MFVLMRHD